jgi:regulator of sigma E protease
MVGEEPDEDLDPQLIPLSFTHKHVLKRILIVFAGPFFNILLAVLIFWVIAFSSGIMILKPSVGSIKDGSPAFLAGFKPGDLVTAIDGVPVETWEAMADRITHSNGKPLDITVKRPEGSVVLRATPELVKSKNLLGEDIKRYVIGIGTAGETLSKKLNLVQAARESLRQTYSIVELMVLIVVKLLTGDISIDTVGGPIMIAQMAGDQAKAGISSLFQFIAVISVNLAIINLLPIPVLDGGHLLFFAIEALKGRPVNLKVREIAQQVGMVILIMLMILVFYNDITRLFFSS